MTRAQERALFAVVLVAAVAVTAAIGHGGGTGVVKAATKQAAISVEPSNTVTFEPERIAAACPSIASGLFGVPVPPLPLRKPTKPSIPPPPPEAVPSAPDPLADYRYTGLTGSGDQAAALIEHRNTKAGHYVRAGDPFLGGTVVAIDSSAVTVQVGSEMLSLPRYDRYTLVPLDKDAPSDGVQVAQQSEPVSLTVVDLVDDGAVRWNMSRLLTTRLDSYISTYRLQVLYGHSDEEAMDRQFEAR